MLWGRPLDDITLGPDPERKEVRGDAQGIVAIGDVVVFSDSLPRPR